MDQAEKQRTPRFRRILFLIGRGLLLYGLFPLLVLIFLAQPIGHAVRSSDPAVFLILLAALAAVCLNWRVYTVVQRKRPSVLVFAYGVFCLLLTAVIENEALAGIYALSSTVAVIVGCLTLAFLFLLSSWFASRPTRPEHAIAVTLWILIAVIAFFMLYQAVRDFEIEHVTIDTWISIAILVALIPVTFRRRILSSYRDRVTRRRATGLAEGRIIQIIGESHLDRDDDLATDYHVRVQYTVDDVLYEIKTDISQITWRWFGKKAFVGQEIPVHYDPKNPANGFTDRIDRHFFDQKQESARTA